MNEERSWRRAARRLAIRLNLALWLGSVLPLWVGGSLVLAAALLFDRGRGGEHLDLLALLFAGFVLASGSIRFVRSRASFFSVEDALVFLDEKLGLRNRLSSAEKGVGGWPEPPSLLPVLVRWRPSRSLVPLAFAAILLALGASVPVSVHRGRVAPPVSEPLSWQEMERALETLRETAVVNEEAIEAFEERLEELRSQPREEWFRHGSLEASDSLREELLSEMRQLARNLERIESALEDTSEGSSPGERRLRERRLRRAIDDLGLGLLPLDRELTRELHVLARDRKVRRATKEEIEKWKALKQRLYHGLPGKGEEVVVGLVRSRESARSSSAEPGRGDVTRGPGTAPIDLSAERTELGSTRVEELRAEDASRGLFGETLGFSLGEHEVDTAGFRGGYEAGAVASRGEGGDLVWSQSLTPSERRVLREYFKTRRGER